MVNPDSDLVRAHPDWVLGARAAPRPGAASRCSTSANPGAYGATCWTGSTRWSTRSASPTSSGTTTATSTRRSDGGTGGRARGRARPDRSPSTGSLDELRGRHPALEIETCSSGGARVDLGILDAHRPGLGLGLQRPPGTAADPALDRAAAAARARRRPRRATRSRTPPTGRTSLGFRTVTALFGHAGMEWDVTTCSDEEVDPAAGLGGALPRGARPAAHRGRRPCRPRRPRAPCCTASWPRTGRRRCSPTSGSATSPNSRPAGCGCPASTPTPSTTWSGETTPASPRRPRSRRRAGGAGADDGDRGGARPGRPRRAAPAPRAGRRRQAPGALIRSDPSDPVRQRVSGHARPAGPHRSTHARRSAAGRAAAGRRARPSPGRAPLHVQTTGTRGCVRV